MATPGFNFGDVVLIPFPFTDQTAVKRRPAVVVSSGSYNTTRRDIVIKAITSQMREPLAFAEITVGDWQSTGLAKASVVKPLFRHYRARARDSCPGAAFSGR